MSDRENVIMTVLWRDSDGRSVVDESLWSLSDTREFMKRVWMCLLMERM